MTHSIYRYQFSDDVDLADVEAALALATIATESLCGEVAVSNDEVHFLDVTARACVIDATTAVGRRFARLFAGFVRREYGTDAVNLRRFARWRDALETVSTA